jgi:hypothetical protein
MSVNDGQVVVTLQQQRRRRWTERFHLAQDTIGMPCQVVPLFFWRFLASSSRKTTMNDATIGIMIAQSGQFIAPSMQDESMGPDLGSWVVHVRKELGANRIGPRSFSESGPLSQDFQASVHPQLWI